MGAAPSTTEGEEVTVGQVINVWCGTEENAHLSNLALRPFNWGVRRYCSVEHAYQSNKSGKFDPTCYSHPGWEKGGVKIPGRLGTDQANSEALMLRLLRFSFGQNPEAAQALRATGNAQITHKQDRGFWGTKFPELLMQVRDELKQQQQGEEVIPF